MPLGSKETSGNPDRTEACGALNPSSNLGGGTFIIFCRIVYMSAVFAFLAAMFFGISTAIQKKALRKIKFSVKNIITNKVWLSSLIVGGVGFLFYILALRSTDLVIVQSFIPLSILVPLIYGIKLKEKIEVYQWLFIGMIILGIILINTY